MKMLNEYVAEIIDEALENWQKMHMELQRLVKLGDAEFRRQQTRLIASIEAHVEAKKVMLTQAGLFQRLYENRAEEATSGSRTYAGKGPKTEY